MYNHDRKVAFQKQYTTSKKTANVIGNIFESLSKYEEKYDMDICQMDAESMQSIFDEVAGIKSSSADAVLYMLRAYARWCLQNGFPGANDSICNIQSPGLSKFKRCMVSGPIELAVYLDNTHNSRADDELVDNVWRGYDWLSFMGVDEKDFLSIKKSDVKLDTMEVICAGRAYDIPKEARIVFSNLVKLKEFNYQHPNYNSVIKKARVKDDILLSSYTSFKDIVILRDRISRERLKALRAGRIDKQLSHNRLYDSGYFYRAYELERAGLEPNFADVVHYKLSWIELTDEENLKKYRSYRTATLRMYKNEYVRWKLAFIKL